MASSIRSGSCGGGRNDEADWRNNRCFLPPWYERPKCTCRRPCTIDVWEWDDTNRARGVISSVRIQTLTLWYGGNFLVLFKFHEVPYIR
jgi:hypothetical protein